MAEQTTPLSPTLLDSLKNKDKLENATSLEKVTRLWHTEQTDKGKWGGDTRHKTLRKFENHLFPLIGEGEWKRKKHQPEYRCQWRKLHIGIDAETLQIRTI